MFCIFVGFLAFSNMAAVSLMISFGNKSPVELAEERVEPGRCQLAQIFRTSWLREPRSVGSQFVLDYIAVPRILIRLEPVLGSRVAMNRNLLLNLVQYDLLVRSEAQVSS